MMRVTARREPDERGLARVCEGAQPGDHGAVWLPEWTHVWVIVHHEEGALVFTDEDLARSEQGVLQENSGAPGLLVGPFELRRERAPLATFQMSPEVATTAWSEVKRLKAERDAELAKLRAVAEAARRWRERRVSHPQEAITGLIDALDAADSSGDQSKEGT